ncbi:RpoE DNA-directed RNA polymerase specialized sigma subunit, sigma24 homolog [Rhabdaerophilaceae bacterium]
MPDSLAIESLIAACAAGDRAALRAIYDQEAPRMLGLARRLVKRHEIAEEVVHDTFLRVWTAAASFSGPAGSGRSWIYTIMRNRALNILRGEARIDLVDDYEPFGLEAPEPSPEAAFSALTEASALRRCLGLLEETRLRIVLLAYVDGLSHGEIAARLNLPLGTIKSWIRRSLLSLKACLQ